MAQRQLFFSDDSVEFELPNLQQSTKSHVENIQQRISILSQIYAGYHETENHRWWRVLIYKASIAITIVSTITSISLAMSLNFREEDGNNKYINIGSWFFTACSLLPAIPWYYTADAPDEKAIASLPEDQRWHFTSLLASLKALYSAQHESNDEEVSEIDTADVYAKSVIEDLEAEDINVRRAERKNKDISYLYAIKASKAGLFTPQDDVIQQIDPEVNEESKLFNDKKL